MEINDYTEVLDNAGSSISKKEKHIWKPFVLQLIISSGVWSTQFLQGLYIGASTVIIAQVRKEANSTDAVTDEMSSWLCSLPLFVAIPLVPLLPWIFYKIGRKYTYLSLIPLQIIAFTIFYNSTNLFHVLISQIFIGVPTASTYTFIPILMTEYTSPNYRGIFLTLKSASIFWGIWVSNAIGSYFHWKNIGKVGLLCSAYNMVTVFAWPESPYWLAMKGRYAESAKSYRRLRGVHESSEKELEVLINRYKIKSSLPSDMDDIRRFSCFSRLWSTITSRAFYKPAFITFTLCLQIQFSGKFVMSIYAIDVLKSLTQNESFAYEAMLILDGVTVFSMYCGCIISRYFNRRTLLFIFSSTGITLLYVMSIYLYLVYKVVVYENHVVILLILVILYIAIGCGPIILAPSIYGEIVPLYYQTSIMALIGTLHVVVTSTLLKISPFMFKHLRMHGYFLFSAISSTVIIIILYIYLPETKDKTIQEIDEQFSGNKNSEDQNKKLLHTK